MEINIQKYLERFTIKYEMTLFPPQWEALRVDKCPFCCNKIYKSLDGKQIYCKSKKHGKFFMKKK